MNKTVTVHSVDVCDATAVERYANEVVQKHGCCHIIVNNAGVTSSGSFLEHDLDTWRRIMDINVMGVVPWMPSIPASFFKQR